MPVMLTAIGVMFWLARVKTRFHDKQDGVNIPFPKLANKQFPPSKEIARDTIRVIPPKRYHFPRSQLPQLNSCQKSICND